MRCGGVTQVFVCLFRGGQDWGVVGGTAQNAKEQQRITFTQEQPQRTLVTHRFVDLETCAKVPGAPGTTQLKVGQPDSHNGRQGATCCAPGAAHQQ